jgi:hypothetical protein
VYLVVYRIALSESLNVVLFYICILQNAYNPKPNHYTVDWLVKLKILQEFARCEHE